MARGESIECPHCACKYCPVRHTQHREIQLKGKKRSIVRRHRVCQHCNLPFVTVETYEVEDQPNVPVQPDPIPPKKSRNPFL